MLKGSVKVNTSKQMRLYSTVNNIGMNSSTMIKKALSKDIVNSMSNQIPVDTGNLKKSLDFMESKDGIEVVMLEYWKFVDLGTRYQSPQNFVGKMQSEVIKKMGNNLEKEVKRKIGGIV